MTAKRFRVNELVKYNYSEIGEYIDENHTDRPLRNDILVELLNELHEENQELQRHIKRSTFNKIRVEDVFNCAKYDKFYDNEEAIKSIDWIAKELGVDFE